MATPAERGFIGNTEITPKRTVLVRVKPLESFQPYAYTGMPVAKKLPIILTNDHHIPIPPDEIDQSHFMQFRINETHRRSTVAGRPSLVPQVFRLIDDERPFSAIIRKGNEQQEISILSQDNEEFGLRFQGLAYVTDRHALRLGRATQYFKEKKRNTERLLQLYEYEELPWEHEIIPVAEYKQRLLERFGKDFPQLADALPKIHFVCWERTMAIPIRFEDLAFSETLEEFNEKFQSIIAVINQKEQLLHGAQAEKFAMEDVYPYIVEYGARKAGEAFGENHKDGIVVTYCSIGNNTAGWELVDLEDVYGVPLGLGDQQRTNIGFADDIQEFVTGRGNAVTSIIYALATMQNRGFFQTETASDEVIVYTFIENFLTSYLHARWGQDLQENIEEILGFAKEIGPIFQPTFIKIAFPQLHTDALKLPSFDTLVNQYYLDYEASLQIADVQSQKKSPNTILEACYDFIERSIKEQATGQLTEVPWLQSYTASQKKVLIDFLSDQISSNIMDLALEDNADTVIERISMLRKKYHGVREK